jgi:predicted DCC family thiol-disulfide oxidoreductase YuxK
MSPPEPAIGVTAEGRHLLLYDGVCGLCNWFVQFVLRRDRRRLFHFAPLQSAAGRTALERSGEIAGTMTTVWVLADYQTAAATPLTRGRAALFVLANLGWPWKAFALFSRLPTAWLNLAYDAVARHRYRLFGRDEHCRVPPPDYRDRFIG